VKAPDSPGGLLLLNRVPVLLPDRSVGRDNLPIVLGLRRNRPSYGADRQTVPRISIKACRLSAPLRHP
jgi:hypothetical protein